MSNRKFPDELLVKWEDPQNDDAYLLTLRDGLTKEEEDGERIGVYQLVAVRRAKVTRELAFSKPVRARPTEQETEENR